MVLAEQLKLWDDEEVGLEALPVRGHPIELMPLDFYDKYIVSLSGGKDSVSALLKLLDLGVDPSKIEIWHQDVDGAITDPKFMDWPVTRAYVRAIGEYFDIPVRFQWRERGFLGELMKQNSRSGGAYYEDPDGRITYLPPSERGKIATRRMWPAMSADMQKRWCSGLLKTEVFRRCLNNHPDFQQGTKDDPIRVLVITGDRREESSNRAKYNEAELHACNSQKRIVHSWRAVIDETEQQVWERLKKYNIMPAPPYFIGYSRLSCMSCIFMTPDLWAILKEIAPDRFEMIANKESELHHTIDQKYDVRTKVCGGTLKRMPKDDQKLAKWIEMSLSHDFDVKDLIMDPWEYPAGAFQGSGGGPM